MKYFTRIFLAVIFLGASIGFLSQGFAQTVSAETIIRHLDAKPLKNRSNYKRLRLRDLKKDHRIRRLAPAIHLRHINFKFNSHVIPRSQYSKVGQIALAIHKILQRRSRELFLIEGHTDAVGSSLFNQHLSLKRARYLRNLLVRKFGIPGRALRIVGYGEGLLLVPVQRREWRNRRVTLRRITDFVMR